MIDLHFYEVMEHVVASPQTMSLSQVRVRVIEFATARANFQFLQIALSRNQPSGSAKLAGHTTETHYSPPGRFAKRPGGAPAPAGPASHAGTQFLVQSLRRLRPAGRAYESDRRNGDRSLAEDFLVATDLRKRFDGIQAVDGVSFTIRRQEIYGLLGPNGAGKTTTIRMLSTVVSPDSGEILIGGHSVQREGDQVRKIIGVCPQDLALYPELSATDNLTFFGKMAGLSGREADEQSRVNLELVGLSDRAKDRVDKFSGGMKRRVNLAIALMSRPALLFLDEPTVGIDPQSRNHIFETILGLRAEGQTILYTTHYMEEADRLCDRLGIIDNGRLIAEGSPAELKSRIGSPDEVTLEEVFLNLTGRSLRD